jgi:tetratricopeptide (TPR) repeat protein
VLDRRGLATALVASLTVSAASCATRQASSSPFIIRSGHGPVHVGNLPEPSKSQRANLERAARQALADRAARAPEALPSIERLDTRLREALGALGRNETTEAHILVAQNYWRVGVYDAAFDHFSDALTLDPRNVSALDGRARVWRHWGMTESALADVHRALFFGPDRADAWNTLGTILEAAGQCVEARAAYDRAVKAAATADWARANAERLHCDRNLAETSRTSPNPPVVQ